MNMHRVLREPLVHFFVLGTALFALYGWVNRGAISTPDEIVVDAYRVDALRSEFERTWQRPPTEQELSALVDSWVREEILYREGVALGLDRNDPVLKRRIAQRVSFMLEQIGSEAPTEETLENWLAEHAEDYRIEATYSFRQVFFDPARHGESLPEAVDTARGALTQGADPATVGDSTLLAGTMVRATAAQVGRNFGDQFAQALAEIEPGHWTGPVPSTYGVHLVYIDAATPARDATIDEVRDRVLRDVEADQRKRADEAMFELLRERYRVRIDSDLAMASDGEGR